MMKYNKNKAPYSNRMISHNADDDRAVILLFEILTGQYKSKFIIIHLPD